MKTKIKDEKLKTFLKSKRVLQRFERNCKELNKPIDIRKDVTTMVTAFVFDKTPEGSDFWWKLSDEFSSI